MSSSDYQAVLPGGNLVTGVLTFTGYLKTAVDNKLVGDLTPDEQTAALAELVKGNYFAVNGAMCQASLDATLNYDYAINALTKGKVPPQSRWWDASYVQTYLTSKGTNKDAC